MGNAKLCINLFHLVWCYGLEEAIMSFDDKARVPLLETYMAYPLGSFDIAIVPRCPAIAIKDNLAFTRVWPKMEASINFLLRWRGIRVDSNIAWLSNYLNIFNSYIEPATNLNNWVDLDFCMPNLEKIRKERNSLVFPLNF